ncbi:MAG: sugar ABC transporter permease [Lachnospiraceae bacterium]|nr:sugar ABC transporter permease [Lachnospiraceae bacterium]
MAEINETAVEEKVSLGIELKTLAKRNLRDYMMYIVLVAIVIFFSVVTGGKFITAGNITNLFNQAAYVAVLAIGMTLILILRQIDLSVGYVAGFSGAVAAILLTNNNWPVFVVIPLVLLIGLCIGMYQGILVTRVGVPAFVTTLAGMFIFRGLLGVITSKSGTIVIKNEAFNTLNNGFIPDIPIFDGIHFMTILIGIIAVILVVFTQIRARKNKERYNFRVVSLPIFVTMLVLVSVVIMVIVTVLAKWRGIPWSAVIVAAILLGYNFLLNKTKLGRYIYGIGGNDQAAELSGVNVKNVMLFAFCSMGVLASLAGILYSSRLQSATPQAGAAFEMDAIASSYIGGVAVSGGVGKVTNTIIGTLVIMSLTNGMNLMGVDTFMQYVVKGIIFILAVAFDVRTRKNN